MTVSVICVNITNLIVLYAILTLHVTQDRPQDPVQPPAVTCWKHVFSVLKICS